MSRTIEAVVEVRKNNENEVFRNRLSNAVSRLHDSAIEDVDRIAAEMCCDVDSGIADHNRMINEISEKYWDKHVKTAVGALGTALGMLVPSLAPVLGPAIPFAAAAKFGWDAWDQLTEKRRKSNSLMGVLAVAKSADAETGATKSWRR